MQNADTTQGSGQPEFCILNSALPCAPSIPPLRVQDLRLGSLAVGKGSEVDMVPRAGTDRVQEGAVHPGHERAIQLAGPAEALHVILDAGDEDVLHLQVSPRMQQRRGVDETLRRAP